MGKREQLAALLTNRAGTNPHIMGEVAQNLDALEVLNPTLAARVRNQEPDAIAEAYESLFRYSKPLESSRGRRQLREVSPALADDLDTADHPQIIRAAEALARQDAFIPTDSLTVSEGARMGKFDGIEAGLRGAAGAAPDSADAIRRILAERLAGAVPMDADVMRALPPHLQAGAMAGDPELTFEAAQALLRQNSPRLPTATPMEGGALITQGGPGVPVGGPTGSGVLMPESRALSTEVIPQPRLPGPPQPRLTDERRGMIPYQRSGPAGPVGDPYDARFATRESMDLPPGGSAVDFDDPALADFLRSQGQPPPPRRPAPPPRRPAPSPNGNAGRRAAGIGAGVLVGAAGARLAMEPNSLGDGEAGLPDAPMAEPAADPMATADLAAEQTPPPQVEVREEPLDAREQAHALMKELNMRRRQAGGEIPEAPQMIRQIETLLSQADDAGNARMRQTMDGGPPSASGPQDYHGQARDLIAQVNMMYRQGMTPNSPEVQRVMQDVRRLQSMGDAQRNAGTTAFPGRR